MDKTTVKVYFRITGDDFNPQIITDKLNIEPTQCWQKNTDVKPTIIHMNPKERQRLEEEELNLLALGIDPPWNRLLKEWMLDRTKPRPRWFSSWYISTDKQESDNINNQIVQIYDLIKDKIDILNELRDEYKLVYSISIVPKIENGENPAMFFDHYIIEFACKIHAVIDIDQYIFS